MLTRLSIHNLAILENIDVSFKDGFTVLTGETGAGKSLIIDSLSLLLGARASSELIRQGEEKATVKGEFLSRQKALEASLDKLGILWNEGNILIERTIGKNRSSIKINGTPISLGDLELIAPILADIHTQFDFAKILNPDNYLAIIDGFSRNLVSNYKKEYALAYSSYMEAKKEYENLLEKQRKLNENRDFYQYQYNELEGLNLKEGEEESIASELSLLRNHDKIYSLEEEARAIIDGDFLDHYYDLNKILAKLASFQSFYRESQKNLEDKYYEISDMLDSIKKGFGETDYDPSNLDKLLQRESELENAKRKYHKSIDELIAYRDELKDALKDDASMEETINEALEKKNQAFLLALNKGKDLSAVRRNIAKSIEKELTKSLADLLLDVRFQIVFADVDDSSDSLLLESGIDTVDFLIETNIGEGLKSLSKVISGGEASRIMLAFKALFIKANKIETAIFDEIDTGISGESAQAVARKIREISLNCQVIAITHMPQVASLSDQHILISKEIRENRTYSFVKELNLDEKIRQVAYLISGDKISDKQLEYAKEMVLAKRV